MLNRTDPAHVGAKDRPPVYLLGASPLCVRGLFCFAWR